jgi:hypothetical protein
MKYEKGDLVEYKKDIFLITEVQEILYCMTNLTCQHVSGVHQTQYTIPYIDRMANKVG